MKTREKLDHALMAKGARIERDAFRRAVRKEIWIMSAIKTPATLAYSNALWWSLDWFSGRAKRTRKLGGVGRLVLLLALLSSPVYASDINLVANGDFSAGNVGFSTDYALGTGGVNSMWDPGLYDVTEGIGDLHSLWTLEQGDGAFMLVNGRTDADSLVWGQSVATTIGQTYRFSASAANVCCKPGVGGEQVPPLLRFLINGNIFGTGLTDGPGHWDTLSGFFTADSAATSLSVRNATTAYGGNDFALDNIMLEPVPEPASLVLFGTGAILAVRKRSKKERA